MYCKVCKVVSIAISLHRNYETQDDPIKNATDESTYFPGLIGQGKFF